jgi:hypothetical protein
MRELEGEVVANNKKKIIMKSAAVTVSTKATNKKIGQ